MRGKEDEPVSTCLVCGQKNDNREPLCGKCGAPLPDVSSHANELPSEGPTRVRRPWLQIAGLAALTLVVIVGLVWWVQSRQETGESLVRTLPAGLDAVYGIDVPRLLETEIVKKAVDLPSVRQNLKETADTSGIDVLKLKGIVGGAKFDAGAMHVLVVGKGTFDVDQVYAAIAPITGKTVRVADHELRSFEMPPMPGTENYAPIVIGALDGSTLVMGSPTLIAAYVVGDSTVDSEGRFDELLDRMDARAFAIGGGFITPATVGSPGAGHPLGVLTGANIPKEGLTWLMTMRLTDALILKMELDLPSEDTAKTIALLLDNAMSNLPFPYDALLGEGRAKVETDGTRILVSLTMKIPEFPTL